MSIPKGWTFMCDNNRAMMMWGGDDENNYAELGLDSGILWVASNSRLPTLAATLALLWLHPEQCGATGYRVIPTPGNARGLVPKIRAHVAAWIAP